MSIRSGQTENNAEKNCCDNGSTPRKQWRKDGKYSKIVHIYDVIVES